MGGALGSLILDLLMAGLLVATIYYCLKLNRRIVELNDSSSELAGMVEKFNASTNQARASITELQNVSRKLSEQLASNIDKANFMADDLSFMIERGGKLADQIEGQLSSSRPSAKTRVAMGSVASNNDEDESETDLSPAAAAPRRRKPSVRPRSRAERELLDAVKKGGQE